MTDESPFGAYLAATAFMDFDHPEVRAYAEQNHTVGASDVDNAVQLYNAVRDDFRYNPWGVVPDADRFKASAVLHKAPTEGGHCIDKANLLAACTRSVGIPSRLHFANVRNHIGTESLEKQLGTDLLVFHGYVELFLDGAWVAATPAFNLELCERLGVEPLQFDGRSNSILQEYDAAGGLFMEYVHDYGSFAEIPFEMMIGEWRKYYQGFAAHGFWPKRPGA
jgi:transglutaminase-like putative cysteine protease